MVVIQYFLHLPNRLLNEYSESCDSLAKSNPKSWPPPFRPPPPSYIGVRPQTLVEKMEQLGYFLRPVVPFRMVNDYHSRRQRCMLCHQVWGHGDLRQAVEQATPCPMLDHWHVRAVNPDRPILARIGLAPTIGGYQLHVSHRLQYLRGFIYCGTCGCYTDGSRVQKLAKPCLIDGVVQTAALNRLQRGVHPRGPRGSWPVHQIERYEIQHYLDITEGA